MSRQAWPETALAPAPPGPSAMPPADHPDMARRRFVAGLSVAWAVLFGLYLLFSGSVGIDELIAGSGSALVGCVWWARAGRIGGKRFDHWFPALRPLGGALLMLPGATVRVGAQLLSVVVRGTPEGSVAYRRGTDSDWATADRPAERAYGLIAASLSPDTFILRDDGGDGGIVDHALARKDATA